MIPAKFDYVRPASVDEAVRALGRRRRGRQGDRGRAEPDAAAAAAGWPSPSCWLTSAGSTSCAASATHGDSLLIGARTTHYQLVHDPLVAEHCGLLAEAAGTVADPAVRHRGTIGGSLAHGDPAGDLPAVALALEATMIARGPGGDREIAAADFFVDYLTTALQPDEILTGIRVPKLGPDWGYHYEKFHRTAQAWAIVGVAALVQALERTGGRSQGRSD